MAPGDDGTGGRGVLHREPGRRDHLHGRPRHGHVLRDGARGCRRHPDRVSGGASRLHPRERLGRGAPGHPPRLRPGDRAVPRRLGTVRSGRRPHRAGDTGSRRGWASPWPQGPCARRDPPLRSACSPWGRRPVPGRRRGCAGTRGRRSLRRSRVERPPSRPVASAGRVGPVRTPTPPDRDRSRTPAPRTPTLYGEPPQHLVAPLHQGPGPGRCPDGGRVRRDGAIRTGPDVRGQGTEVGHGAERAPADDRRAESGAGRVVRDLQRRLECRRDGLCPRRRPKCSARGAHRGDGRPGRDQRVPYQRQLLSHALDHGPGRMGARECRSAGGVPPRARPAAAGRCPPHGCRPSSGQGSAQGSAVGRRRRGRAVCGGPRGRTAPARSALLARTVRRSRAPRRRPRPAFDDRHRRYAPSTATALVAVVPGSTPSTTSPTLRRAVSVPTLRTSRRQQHVGLMPICCTP